ncbi:MAG TPA: hypothetical protein PKA06_10865, partial [Gemmatales bacterium]|nr:hypothetical protein [Gemmatales bacterium]
HTIFGQAQEYHHRIGKLSVGVNCSACGQPVTAEHAEKERQQATARLTEAKQALEAAEQRLSHANQELQRHAEALQQLQSQWQAKTQALLKLETSRRNYQHYGALEPPAELEKQVLALREKYQQEREQLLVVRNRLDALEALQKKSEAHVQKWTQQLEQKKNDQQKLNTETATLTGQLQSTREQLPEVLHSASTADVDPLMRELQTLTQCQIEKQFQELSESRHQFALLQQQMQDIENKLNEIPETARLRSEEAEQLLQLATHDKSKAEQEWQHARDQHQSLRREAEVYKNASSELAHMEHRQRLLKLLDEKLGKKGLQLAMMQDAQVQIVELARQTLLQLSNHELSLELNPPDGDTADQALDLCVRHAESAHVTPMEYLSGSQKFRVAIAIALAIGRYAAGQSRPLESVIIDEGFGSLDREGLQAMAEELLELQRSQLLRRIILVSHQEEFADRFAAGYTLSPSEQGTQVKAWRR